MNALASLAEYCSDDEVAADDAAASAPTHLRPVVTTAPLHSAPACAGQGAMKSHIVAYDPKQAFLTTHNPLKRDLMAPAAGPKHPNRSESFMPHLGNAATQNGFIAPTSVAPWAFEEQYYTYNSMGYAVGVDGKQVGDSAKAAANGGQSVSTLQPSSSSSSSSSSSGPRSPQAQRHAGP
jgi:hypothetical protein